MLDDALKLGIKEKESVSGGFDRREFATNLIIHFEWILKCIFFCLSWYEIPAATRYVQ
jgi:hypothetical protein